MHMVQNKLREGRTNVHNEECSWTPSISNIWGILLKQPKVFLTVTVAFLWDNTIRHSLRIKFFIVKEHFDRRRWGRWVLSWVVTKWITKRNSQVVVGSTRSFTITEKLSRPCYQIIDTVLRPNEISLPTRSFLWFMRKPNKIGKFTFRMSLVLYWIESRTIYQIEY